MHFGNLGGNPHFSTEVQNGWAKIARQGRTYFWLLSPSLLNRGPERVGGNSKGRHEIKGREEVMKRGRELEHSFLILGRRPSLLCRGSEWGGKIASQTQDDRMHSRGQLGGDKEYRDDGRENIGPKIQYTKRGTAPQLNKGLSWKFTKCRKG